MLNNLDLNPTTIMILGKLIYFSVKWSQKYELIHRIVVRIK